MKKPENQLLVRICIKQAEQYSRLLAILLYSLVVSVVLMDFVSANPEVLDGRRGIDANADRNARWTAYWIQFPDTIENAYGVFHFRREFSLDQVPESFRIRVTADQRYQLFVNGILVSRGPARSDLQHWQFDCLDIAAALKKDENVLACVVWNYGDDTPFAQVSSRTGFWLQGETELEAVVDTNCKWMVREDYAYAPSHVSDVRGSFYYVAGPGERVDGTRYPWGWEDPESNLDGWSSAEEIVLGSPRGEMDPPSAWMLVPREIPMMKEEPGRLSMVRLSQGLTCNDEFLSGNHPLTIDAYSNVRILLDNGVLETAYPELFLEGGRGSSIRLSYSENLWVKNSIEKGNRDEIEGKEFEGQNDTFLPDGKARVFSPLYWRTFRYIEVLIETKDEPLKLSDIKYSRTGYPFVNQTHFQGGPSDLDEILDTGWRTARLCAHETYMDCPYYEQLQYVGDTRIQALASLLLTSDGRLARHAIAQLNYTRNYEGITYSRAPSANPQFIPTFSLLWIGMLHDYWMFQGDESFVVSLLPAVRATLEYFSNYQNKSGILEGVPWWNFVDWVPEWNRGVPPQDANGHSSVLDLHLLMALQWASDIESNIGSEFWAQEYRGNANRLRESIQSTYWDNDKCAYSDTPSGPDFSQHANVLAVLSGVITGDHAKQLLQKIEDTNQFTPTSLYFRFYADEARRIAGMGEGYFDRLKPWREMLKQGLTTWAETSQNTRSDCHAWGISPNIQTFRTVLGIDSLAPGFKKVKVQPQIPLGTSVSGTVPHPCGEIVVSVKRSTDGIIAKIKLPDGIDGIFIAEGKEKPLCPDENRICIESGGTIKN